MGITDSFFQKHSSTFKVIIIGILALAMLIPLSMIENLVGERLDSYDRATEDVGKMWSLPQTISGPVLNIPVPKDVISVTPETLFIKGDIRTEVLHKSIYDVAVYHSVINLSGIFTIPDDVFYTMDGEYVSVDIELSDLRGIEEEVFITMDDTEYEMTSSLRGGVITAKVKINKEHKTFPYNLDLKLKGSKSIEFAPSGNVTEVDLSSKYTSPSFCGEFLPVKRNIDENGFSAHWKVLDMNRSNPAEAMFGVELLIPVTQYQQTMRAVKYGILIILLVFVAAYLVEISTKKEIHLLQYLLIGLALVLFYTLLLSISEFISFGWSYLIASSMTVILIGGYFISILRSRHAWYITLLLIVLYAFIYMLLQMEAYALLAGSLGLFLILGMIMYFTKR